MIDEPKQLTDSQKILVQAIAEEIEKRLTKTEEQQARKVRSIWQAIWKGIGVIKAEVEIIFGWKK